MKIWNNEEETGTPSPWTVTVTGPYGVVAVATGATELEATTSAVLLQAEGARADRDLQEARAFAEAAEVLDSAVIMIAEGRPR